MRILFSTDFHGDFSRLMKVAHYFDLCISCGDIFDYHKIPEKFEFPIPFFSIKGNKELWARDRFLSKFENYHNFYWLNDHQDQLNEKTGLNFLGIDFLREPKEIPSNIDFLISHQPAYGIADQCSDSFHTKMVTTCGSRKIRALIERNPPDYLISGHVHHYQEGKLGKTVAISLTPALTNPITFWEDGNLQKYKLLNF
ncbi:MAG: metallophosphoesterase family protein [Candidatus Hodarchaeales archaeon]